VSDHQARVAGDTAFLIEESCKTLRRFADDPESHKLESVIQTVELCSSLVKRLDGVSAQEVNDSARSAIPIIPMNKIALFNAIARGEHLHCTECKGWKPVC
jgi:hypothetical protein